MVEYSRHAQRKMAERSISKERVEMALRQGRRSPDIKNRQRAVATIENRETTVIFIQEDDRLVVITVWDELSEKGAS
ncbi:MAG: DUF4258 domain-containing protein [Dehalococcoidia bacterium]